MPIEYLTGDATQPVGEGSKIIAHVSNDIGAWGKGFVVPLAKRYPQAKRAYLQAFADGASLPLGALQIVEVAPQIAVANMIGQHKIVTRFTRPDEVPPIRYEALQQCLAQLAAIAQQRQASVHMPRIGCGLAGGRWERVLPLIEQSLCAAGVPVFVYDLPQ